VAAQRQVVTLGLTETGVGTRWWRQLLGEGGGPIVGAIFRRCGSMHWQHGQRNKRNIRRMVQTKGSGSTKINK
jgi:hypothetical protein